MIALRRRSSNNITSAPEDDAVLYGLLDWCFVIISVQSAVDYSEER